MSSIESSSTKFSGVKNDRSAAEKQAELNSYLMKVMLEREDLLPSDGENMNERMVMALNLCAKFLAPSVLADKTEQSGGVDVKNANDGQTHLEDAMKAMEQKLNERVVAEVKRTWAMEREKERVSKAVQAPEEEPIVTLESAGKDVNLETPPPSVPESLVLSLEPGPMGNVDGTVNRQNASDEKVLARDDGVDQADAILPSKPVSRDASASPSVPQVSFNDAPTPPEPVAADEFPVYDMDFDYGDDVAVKPMPSMEETAHVPSESPAKENVARTPQLSPSTSGKSVAPTLVEPSVASTAYLHEIPNASLKCRDDQHGYPVDVKIIFEPMELACSDVTDITKQIIESMVSVVSKMTDESIKEEDRVKSADLMDVHTKVMETMAACSYSFLSYSILMLNDDPVYSINDIEPVEKKKPIKSGVGNRKQRRQHSVKSGTPAKRSKPADSDKDIPSTSASSSNHIPPTDEKEEIVCCNNSKMFHDVKVLLCSAPERCVIKMNEEYWKGPRNLIEKHQKEYCISCFEDPDTFPGGDSEKDQFDKKTNEVGDEEKKYECRSCGKKAHQMCLNASESVSRNGKFVCDSCKPIQMNIAEQPLVDSLKENVFSRDLQAYLRTELQSDDFSCRLLNLSRENVVTTHICPQSIFSIVRKKFKGMTFVARTVGVFQRIKGCDILLAVLFCQEYNDYDGQKITVQSGFESVQVFDTGSDTDGPERNHHENAARLLLDFYTKYAQENGFTLSHLYAKAADAGVSYCFRNKPHWQEHLDQDKLQEWFGETYDMLSEKKVIEKWESFEQFWNNQPFENYSDIKKLPLFDESLWSTMLNWSVVESKGSEAEFVAYMKDMIQKHGNDNFFLSLSNSSQNPPIEEEFMPTAAFKTPVSLSKFLDKNDMEFGSFRQMKYASGFIILEVKREMEQAEREEHIKIAKIARDGRRN